MTSFTLYSRSGCHLCDVMREVVARVARDLSEPIQLEEIDISTDPELESRYGLEIPVLLIDGRKVAKHRLEEAALRRRLGIR